MGFISNESAEMLLSCTEQESNQRSRLGGGVDAKSIDATAINQPF
jgi:hypothetical protein